MPSIRAVRLGFLYQDKFALFTYLTNLQAGNIVEEFYIDYPLQADQKSLDIKIILNVRTVRQEKVYEVKTGESFKEDQTYDGTSEIREAIMNFYIYSAVSETAAMEIIVSPELKGKIATYWRHIQQIEGLSNYVASGQQAASGLCSMLNITELSDPKTLFHFCKKINMRIHEGMHDGFDGEADQYTALDDAIISKIRDLNSVFEAEACEDELPPALLYHELMHICQRYIGTTDNMVPAIEDTIVRFFTRRKLIQRRTNTDFYGLYPQMKEVFARWKTQSPPAPEPETSPTNLSEGGITS